MQPEKEQLASTSQPSPLPSPPPTRSPFSPGPDTGSRQHTHPGGKTWVNPRKANKKSRPESVMRGNELDL